MLGHADLVRKFNVRHPYFDEGAAWYREEVERTAEAIDLVKRQGEFRNGIHQALDHFADVLGIAIEMTQRDISP